MITGWRESNPVDPVRWEERAAPICSDDLDSLLPSPEKLSAQGLNWKTAVITDPSRQAPNPLSFSQRNLYRR